MKFKKALAVTLAATTVLTSANVTGLITPVDVEAALATDPSTPDASSNASSTGAISTTTGSKAKMSYSIATDQEVDVTTNITCADAGSDTIYSVKYYLKKGTTGTWKEITSTTVAGGSVVTDNMKVKLSDLGIYGVDGTGVGNYYIVGVVTDSGSHKIKTSEILLNVFDPAVTEDSASIKVGTATTLNMKYNNTSSIDITAAYNDVTAGLDLYDEGANKDTTGAVVSYTIKLDGEAVTGHSSDPFTNKGTKPNGASANKNSVTLPQLLKTDALDKTYIGKTITIEATVASALKSGTVVGESQTIKCTPITINIVGDDTSDGIYDAVIKGKAGIKVGDVSTLTGIVNKNSEDVVSKGVTKYTWEVTSGSAVEIVDGKNQDKEVQIKAKATGKSNVRLTVQQIYEDKDGYTQLCTTSTDYLVTVDKAEYVSSTVESPKFQNVYLKYNGTDTDNQAYTRLSLYNTTEITNAIDSTAASNKSWAVLAPTEVLKTSTTSVRMAKVVATGATLSAAKTAAANLSNVTISANNISDATSVTDFSTLDNDKWYAVTVSGQVYVVMFRNVGITVKNYEPHVMSIAGGTTISTLVKDGSNSSSTYGERQISMTVTVDADAETYYQDKGGKFIPNITLEKSGIGKDAVEVYDVTPGTLSGTTMTVTAKVKATATYKDTNGGTNDIKIKPVINNGNKYEGTEFTYNGGIVKSVRKSELSFQDNSTTKKATYDPNKTIADHFASLVPADTEYIDYEVTYRNSADNADVASTTKAADTYKVVVTAKPKSGKSVMDDDIIHNTDDKKTYTVQIEAAKITNADINAAISALELKTSYTYGATEATIFKNMSSAAGVTTFKKNGVVLTLKKSGSDVSTLASGSTNALSGKVEGVYKLVASADTNYVAADDIKVNTAVDFSISKVEGVGSLVGLTGTKNVQVASNGVTTLTASVMYGSDANAAAANLSEKSPSYKWYKNGEEIANAGATLASAGKGTYKCKITFIADPNMNNALDKNDAGEDLTTMTVWTNEVTVAETDITATVSDTSTSLAYSEGGKTAPITIRSTSGLKDYTVTLEDKDGNVVVKKSATYTESQTGTTVMLDVPAETDAGTYTIHVVAHAVDGSAYDSANLIAGDQNKATITKYVFETVAATDFVVENVVYGSNEKDAVVKFNSANELKNKYWDKIVKKVEVTTEDDATSTGEAELSIKVTFNDTADIPNFTIVGAGNVDADSDGVLTADVKYEVVQKPVSLGIKAGATYDISDVFDSASYVTNEGFIADDLTKLDVVYYSEIIDADGKIVDATALKKGEYKLVAHVVDEKFFDNYTFVNGTGTLKVTDEKGDALIKAQDDAADQKTKADALTTENDALKDQIDSMYTDEELTAAKKDAATAATKDMVSKEDAERDKSTAVAAATEGMISETDAAEAVNAEKDKTTAAQTEADKQKAEKEAAQKAQKDAETKLAEAQKQAAAANATATTAQATAAAATDAQTAVGAEALVGKTAVTVTAADAVQVTGTTSSKVTIGKTVTINGKTFTVASIAKNAFKGSAATVTIKNTSVTIAKNAFKSFKGKVVLSKKLSTKAKKAMVKKLTKAGVKKSQISYK